MADKVKLSNKKNKKKFISDNISLINLGIRNFANILPDDLKAMYAENDIKKYLNEKFNDEVLNNIEKQKEIIKNFKELLYKKAKIIEVANNHVYYKSDVEEFIERSLFAEFKTNFTVEIAGHTAEFVFEKVGIDINKKKFLQNKFYNVYKKALYLSMQNGFVSNLTNMDAGLMMANSGDSAQFLFVGRAILAGYNCSNVDVRSSKYDAIIDYEGRLLKVQVKGISGSSISFWDMPRGGVTSNHTHKRRRVKIGDCDIFVAVDKQMGICYIIPMKDIENWTDNETQSVSVENNKITPYKENWDIISTVIPFIQ